MNARTVALLALGVVVLFAVMWVLDAGDRGGRAHTGLLLPDLKPVLNDVREISVTSADGTVTIENDGGRWVVPGKDGYPADTGKLRSLLLDLADARKVEEKTSNPEMYERLGVQDPQDGGDGLLVRLAGDGAAFEPVSVILGEPAQSDYRYARLPAEAASWLIDRNPDVPGAGGDWLAQAIVDIPSSRVQSVEIRHQDGERIRIAKDSSEATNFAVEDVPEGRELSYPSVANPIAGVLSNLTLEDVRRMEDTEAEPAAVARFVTFDGLQIAVAAWLEDGEEEDDAWTWITLQASGEAALAGEAASSADSRTDEEEASDEAEATVAEADAEAPTPDPGAQAEDINTRVAGWQFRIPDYKGRQLTRRWDDLLAEADTDADE